MKDSIHIQEQDERHDKPIIGTLRCVVCLKPAPLVAGVCKACRDKAYGASDEACAPVRPNAGEGQG